MAVSVSLWRQFVRTLFIKIVLVQIVVGGDPPPTDDEDYERNAAQRKA